MGTPQRTLPKLSSLLEYLEHYADLNPEAIALWDDERQMDWQALRHQVQLLAQEWLHCGIEPGDRVGFLGAPSIDFWLTFLAAQSVGAVWVGINPQYTYREIAHVLTDAAPRVVFRSSDMDAAAVEPLRAAWTDVGGAKLYRISDAPDQLLANQLGADELVDRKVAMIVYTSGTTGRPKGALLTGSGLVENGWWIARRLGGVPQRTLVNLPVNHIGCVGDVCVSAFLTGGTLVFQAKFDPVDAVRMIREREISWVAQVPAQFQLLLDRGGVTAEDLASIRCLMWGGAPMPRGLIEQYAVLVPDLCCSYGLTECSGTITISPPGTTIERLADSVGQPVSEDRLRIVDGNGQPLVDGECGEIQLAGPHLFAGYLHAAEATAEAFTQDGWLKTGDLGCLLEDGSVALRGRTREMFKSGGYNVYPREVEEVIEALSDVELCAVVPTEDELWSEVGVAFVQSQSGRLSADALKEHCSMSLAKYKVPKFFVLLADLPLLPIGKVDTRQLIESWEQERERERERSVNG